MSLSRYIGGILLVSGTTIGAGMLALPVATGFAGFLPSAALLILYWAFMVYTAFLTLEVNLWMTSRRANMITMAKTTLGPWGRLVSWLLYLFLLYALTTAYLAGCGPIVVDVIQSLTGVLLPKWVGMAPLLLVFGFFIYQGVRSVDYLNRLLMICLSLAYLAMVYLAFPHVDASLLLRSDWKAVLIGSSIAATSFGFHIIIPSLTQYLDRDVDKLKRIIFIGSAIPLVVYLIWELIVLGIVPLNTLAEGYRLGSNGAHLLTETLGQGPLSLTARFFSFFAIVTSFLGVSLSLADFLADGFRIEKSPVGKWIICFLTFGPPLLFVIADPRAFLSALEYAGAFGVVLLLGLMPALMVWRGRKTFQGVSLYTTPGGNLGLFAAMILAILLIGVELLIKFGAF